MSETLPAQRKFCYRCRRAGEGCYCTDIQTFRPPFDLFLIVHPRESRNLVGSVRIAHLSCEHSTWVEGIGEDIDRSPIVLGALSNPKLAPMILYPSPHAVPLDRMTAQNVPNDRRLALFVIDGTWYQAKQLIRRSLILSTLPSVSFTTDRVSEYGFRKQPHDYCLSTVEAVHVAIDAYLRSPVAPPMEARPHDRMMDIFRKMVRTQLAFNSQPRSLRNPI